MFTRILAVLVLSCSPALLIADDPPPAGVEKKEAKEARDPSVGGLTDADSKTTGAIAGKIVFKGKMPEMKPIPIPPEHRDLPTCGKEVPYERHVFGPGNALANVVVSLDKIPGAPKPQKRDIALDNAHCRFVPHVQATTAGSKLKVTSQDPILHSANALLGNPFNVAVTPDKPVEKTLFKPGWMPVTCATHGWMQAHIWVFPHDFFAVTSKEGKFRIQGVPPGKYSVKVWHEAMDDEALDKAAQEVTVEAGKPSELKTIELSPSEN